MVVSSRLRCNVGMVILSGLYFLGLQGLKRRLVDVDKVEGEDGKFTQFRRVNLLLGFEFAVDEEALPPFHQFLHLRGKLVAIHAGNRGYPPNKLICLLVEDVRFQIDSNPVTANHCKIYRMRIINENMEDSMSVFLKDTSTNGTYLNWEKLKKNNAAVKVHHGDIISFSAPPQHEEFISENKRLKGLGIGAPEGPISLEDFRSLQRSNTVC
ncbi:hypothetical protein AHAS_Ahas16G0156500 [Arachis hypogaea]